MVIASVFLLHWAALLFYRFSEFTVRLIMSLSE